MKNNNLKIMSVVLLVGGLGFFIGMKFQVSKTADLRDSFQGGQNINNIVPQLGGIGASPSINGEIVSVDGKNITIKMTDGSNKIIILTDNTYLNKNSDATRNDLNKGNKVMVWGSNNIDGSFTALTVQLNPYRGKFNGVNNLIPSQTK